MATLSAASPPGSIFGFAGGFGYPMLWPGCRWQHYDRKLKKNKRQKRNHVFKYNGSSKDLFITFWPKKKTRTQFDVWSLGIYFKAYEESTGAPLMRCRSPPPPYSLRCHSFYSFRGDVPYPWNCTSKGPHYKMVVGSNEFSFWGQKGLFSGANVSFREGISSLVPVSCLYILYTCLDLHVRCLENVPKTLSQMVGIDGDLPW